MLGSVLIWLLGLGLVRGFSTALYMLYSWKEIHWFDKSSKIGVPSSVLQTSERATKHEQFVTKCAQNTVCWKQHDRTVVLEYPIMCMTEQERISPQLPKNSLISKSKKILL